MTEGKADRVLYAIERLALVGLFLYGGYIYIFNKDTYGIFAMAFAAWLRAGMERPQ